MYADFNEESSHLLPPVRQEAAFALKRTVADLVALYYAVRKIHWKQGNVRGTTLIKLDEFAGELMGHVDYTVDRLQSLGAPADGVSCRSSSSGRLGTAQWPSRRVSLANWKEELAELHKWVGHRGRHTVKHLVSLRDFASADVVADIVRTLDLHLFLLETELNRRPLKPRNPISSMARTGLGDRFSSETHFAFHLGRVHDRNL